MFKLKLKLSLVDDYIFICKVNNCYNTFGDKSDDIESGIIEITTSLKYQYEHIFFKLGYLDNSLDHLKEQIKYSKCLDIAFFNCNNHEIAHKNLIILQKLKEIKQNMIKKMKKLTFTQEEIKFVLDGNA